MVSNEGNVAIVIGASIAGLLAAQVASKHFDHVVILDQDELSSPGKTRTFSPQANHAHLLHHHGGDIIEGFFPGFYDRLMELGSVQIAIEDFAWFSHGYWKHSLRRLKNTHVHYSQMRGFIDQALIGLIQKNSKVTLRESHKVVGYLFDQTNSRINGVKVRTRGEETEASEFDIPADLVIDTSGNSSSTPNLLVQLGYRAPKVSKVGLDITYVSQIMSLPQKNYGWKLLAHTPPAPCKRGFLMIPVSGGRWLVTQAEVFAAQTPDTHEKFIEFAKSQSLPHLYEIIKDGQPLSTVRRYRFPGSSWKRYHEVTSLPDGLIALGDAVLRLNPIYGQGMTASAVSANCLNQCLNEYYAKDGPRLAGFPHVFFRKMALSQKIAWELNVREDFRYSRTTGSKPFLLKTINYYLLKVLELSSQDPHIFETFFAVLNMQLPPRSFFRPYIFKEVIFRLMGLRKMRPVDSSQIELVNHDESKVA